MKLTCDGEDLSPALEWTAPVAGAKSLVLIVDDPDAPDPRAPRTIWAHWLLYNLPAAAGALPRGAGGDRPPPGARAGKNDSHRLGYSGPCPPVGRHRYFHRLYALDVALPDLGEPTRKQLLAATEGHVLETAELVGTYQRRGRR